LIACWKTKYQQHHAIDQYFNKGTQQLNQLLCFFRVHNFVLCMFPIETFRLPLEEEEMLAFSSSEVCDRLVIISPVKKKTTSEAFHCVIFGYRQSLNG